MSDQAKSTFFSGLQQNLDQLRDQGLYKPERVLASRQGSEVVAQDGRTLINMCANNYLGLTGQESGTYLGHGEWSKTRDAGVIERTPAFEDPELAIPEERVGGAVGVVERLPGLHVSFLNKIVGLGCVASQPNGGSVQVVDVCHRLGFEDLGGGLCHDRYS